MMKMALHVRGLLPKNPQSQIMRKTLDKFQ